MNQERLLTKIIELAQAMGGLHASNAKLRSEIAELNRANQMLTRELLELRGEVEIGPKIEVPA